jgi:hypothetical protein
MPCLLWTSRFFLQTDEEDLVFWMAKRSVRFNQPFDGHAHLQYCNRYESFCGDKMKPTLFFSFLLFHQLKQID